jgi:orotidine-5'-phosphate decarboxylase
MSHFADNLVAAATEKKSCVVVGLDPRLDRLPEPLKSTASQSRDKAAQAILDFNIGIMEAVAPYTVAVKPQVAFYETLGWQGFRAYEETIRAAHDQGLLVIADMKRGDIGSTAEAYADACFGAMDSDAVTINAYLGSDGVKPFMKWADRGKGIFVLVKTSNPSSAELQDRNSDGALVYERMADLVAEWGQTCVGSSGYSAVGAVVGATWPEQARVLRKRMPHTPFLLPGYGAQGAGAEDCAPAFDASGLGAVVNSSRGIIFAYEQSDASDWQQPVAEAALAMRDDLQSVCLPK